MPVFEILYEPTTRIYMEYLEYLYEYKTPLFPWPWMVKLLPVGDR